MNRLKGWLRFHARRFLGIDHIDLWRSQADQITTLTDRMARLEQIVYELEESHFRSIGEPRPRRDKIFVGGADNFAEVGEEFMRHFKSIAGLGPTERVLDVGCGIGRIALPLTKYLSRDGCYEGFDIVKEGIDWCAANITPRYPNFHFQLADVFNTYYNPTGKYHPEEYRFPYEDASFDFVFLTSVFTHVLPAAMQNYLCEIARVLKRGGRCLITFFLWNAAADRLVRSGKSQYDFRYDYGMHRVQKADMPDSPCVTMKRMCLGYSKSTV